MINKHLYDRFIAAEFQTKSGISHRQTWSAPATATAVNVRAAITLLASTTQVYLKNSYVFTVTSAAATKGAVYSDGVTSFTVVATIAGSTSLILTTAGTATLASGTLTKVSGTGDATITFASHAATVAIVQPDVVRAVTITPTKGSGSAITGNVVITGADIRGNAVTDTIACGADTVAVNGAVAFKTITSITVPARGQANDTISVGYSVKLGLERICVEDSCFQTLLSGTKDSAVAVITPSSTDISKNLITLTTPPNGSNNIVAYYLTQEITTDKNVTA